jgi:CheY-like chemotaxis protein
MKLQPNQTILVVEDSPDDYAMIKRGFKKARMANPVYHCEDGEEALDFLFHKGDYAPPNNPPLPGIILLDLNLPGTDGHEVLNEIKNNPELKKIPIIVLTTSSDERDIEKSYRNGANSYITKPVTFSGFTEAIQRLKEYWFSIVILPKGE